MKLRNKKTGKIGYTAVLQSKAIVVMDENAIQLGSYYSLAELNEEWEDYKESKEPYFITEYGKVFPLNVYEDYNNVANLDDYKQLGNYFDSREEAEKAVEKLKAWKRLKDKKIFIWLDHFDYRSQDGSFNVEFGDNLSSDELNQVNDDLDLLFGGEE